MFLFSFRESRGEIMMIRKDKNDLPMKINFVYTLLAFLIVSCAFEDDNLENTITLEDLNLPEGYYNYEAIEIPSFYYSNDFESAQDFQQAAMDLDNMPTENPITNAGATLGRVLFYDENLSSNGRVSCASCHQPNEGFSDDSRTSRGVDGQTDRHSMSLANARFYSTGKFFWDERASSLEEQVLMPFTDETEMGLTLTELVDLVDSQNYYADLFEDAYGASQVSSEGISNALAQFIRSMVSVTSPYDIARAEVNNALEDFPAFTNQENMGKRLFFQERTLTNGNQVSCAACHVSEAFVGSNPLLASNNTVATHSGLEDDDDLGVGEVTGSVEDHGKFKVPSLKNIALTAPYMHDGRFDNLEEVINHYSNGINDHQNSILVNANGEVGQFRFSDQERAALISFLETLTDTEMLTDEKYSNPFENVR